MDGLSKHLSAAHTYYTILSELEQTHTDPFRRYQVIYDNVTLEDIFFHKKDIAKAIAQSIQKQQYTYKPLSQSVIVIKDKKRQVYPHFITDLVVQRAIYQYVSVKYDSHLTDNVYSYRKQRSAVQARNRFRHYISQYYSTEERKDLYVLKIDLENYTDSIPLDQRSQLWRLFSWKNSYEAFLFQSACRAEYLDDDGQNSHLVGVPMGSPLTPLVANFYLNALDHQLAALADCDFIRFGDDILMISADASIIVEAGELIKAYVQEHRLKLNQEKTQYLYFTYGGIPAKHAPFSGVSEVHYLGHRFYRDGTSSLSPEKITKITRQLKKTVEQTHGLVRGLPLSQRGNILCESLNAVLLNQTTFTGQVMGEQLACINHRGMLKKIDHYLALCVASALTQIKSVKAFRQVPYRRIRDEFGLISLCHYKDIGRL